MPKQKRPRLDVEKRREQIAGLYARGFTQLKIGEMVGCTQQQVSLDLKRIRQKWLESTLRDFNEAKAQELAKIDQAERQAWRGWTRSLRDAETVKVTEEGEDAGKRVVTTKGQAGDPRFIELVLKCIERRCKLLGLDAPVRSDITGQLGGNVHVYLPDNLRQIEDRDWYGNAGRPPAATSNGRENGENGLGNGESNGNCGDSRL